MQTGHKISTDRDAVIAAVNQMLLPPSEARPKTAWAAYSRERRPILQAENTHLGGRDIVRMIASEWKQVKRDPELLLKYEEMCLPTSIISGVIGDNLGRLSPTVEQEDDSSKVACEDIAKVEDDEDNEEDEEEDTEDEQMDEEDTKDEDTLDQDKSNDRIAEDLVVIQADSSIESPQHHDSPVPTLDQVVDLHPEPSFETFKVKFAELIINREPTISSSRLNKMTRQYWKAATDDQINQIMSSK